ncbi:hypothetical protein P3T27_006487 [Kitasatospora sp. MAA19]|uniref:hypothetical protein n=1 Tax=Kitasatospora sp. MAA19 TaxID=3035090 RepID=UPI002475EAC0|nr:hypothetical protein [Kitasatospora sp. MAA19]MDH6709738.1 hypothetical protein [Kitasatospora sp. MAA19]
MHNVSTLRADNPQQLADRLAPLASAEYLAGRAGQLSTPQAGQTQVPGELWLLAVARVSSDPGEWTVYALTSAEDIPGWPHSTGYYTGGVRGPRDVAAALAAAGYQVALRHYAGLAVACTDQDVPLT